jgi:formiminoglutamate deiminase
VKWHARAALVDGVEGVAEDVLLETEGDRLVRVTAGVMRPADATPLNGFTIPGLANAHSHAFHRALRGQAQAPGDFWEWRRRMYELAARLDPDRYYALARACFAEMVVAGVTAVGEFHYLHHGPGGVRYDDPNAMGHAVIAAAAEAGVRLTLLDSCYLRSGFDSEPLDPVQQRFSDGDADAWAARVEALEARDQLLIGAAIHSVRAVDPKGMEKVARAARGRRLHLHLSEQPAEVSGCLAATGRTPAQLAADVGALARTTTAVHATHVTNGDLALLAASGTGVCLCPTTERDLGDGIGPAVRLAAAGVALSLGSDSQAVVDLFEEARAVELDERLAHGRRGLLPPAFLLGAATAAGSDALGWGTGQLAPGGLADFTTIGLGSVRLAGARTADLVTHAVYAAAAPDVSDVVVGGRVVVRDGCHVTIPDVPAALAAALRALEDR